MKSTRSLLQAIESVVIDGEQLDDDIDYREDIVKPEMHYEFSGDADDFTLDDLEEDGDFTEEDLDAQAVAINANIESRINYLDELKYKVPLMWDKYNSYDIVKKITKVEPSLEKHIHPFCTLNECLESITRTQGILEGVKIYLLGNTARLYNMLKRYSIPMVTFSKEHKKLLNYLSRTDEVEISRIKNNSNIPDAVLQKLTSGKRDTDTVNFSEISSAIIETEIKTVRREFSVVALNDLSSLTKFTAELDVFITYTIKNLNQFKRIYSLLRMIIRNSSKEYTLEEYDKWLYDLAIRADKLSSAFDKLNTDTPPKKMTPTEFAEASRGLHKQFESVYEGFVHTSGILRSVLNPKENLKIDMSDIDDVTSSSIRRWMKNSKKLESIYVVAGNYMEMYMHAHSELLAIVVKHNKIARKLI